MTHPFIVLPVVGAVAIATIFTAGCSSGAGSASVGAGATTVGTGSTYVIVPDAQVAAGLKDVRRLANEAKADLGTNPDGAKAKTTEMYQLWYTFEGTIKQNDKNAYLQIEDAMASVRKGAESNDPAALDKGIEDLAAGATVYLKAHP